MSNFVELGGGEEALFLRLSPVLAFGVSLVIRNVMRGARITLAGAMLALVFGILVVHVIGNFSLMPVVSLLLWLPAIVTPTEGYSRDALLSGARWGVALALGFLALSAVTSSQSFIGPCRLDKCSIWGVALGQEGLGNALGVFFAAATLISLTSARTWQRAVVSLAASVALVDLTSSRSAMYSWLLIVLIACACWISAKTNRGVFVAVAATSAAAIAIALPLWPLPPQAFTLRAGLWQEAVRLFHQNEAFGYGSSFWVRGAATGQIDRNYSTHSLLPELLVSVGLVGTVAFGIALVAATRGRGGASRFLACAFTAALIALSLTEVFSAPGRTYLNPTFAVFAFMLCAAHVSGQRQPTDSAKRTTARPKLTFEGSQP